MLDSEESRSAEVLAVDLWLCGGSWANWIAPAEDVMSAIQMSPEAGGKFLTGDHDAIDPDLGCVLADQVAECRCCGEKAIFGIAIIPYTLWRDHRN